MPLRRLPAADPGGRPARPGGPDPHDDASTTTWRSPTTTADGSAACAGARAARPSSTPPTDPEIGLTFAMGAEIALFLEGLPRRRAGPRTSRSSSTCCTCWASGSAMVATGARWSGRRMLAGPGSARSARPADPFRNAGALCAVALPRHPGRRPTRRDSDVVRSQLSERSPSGSRSCGSTRRGAAAGARGVRGAGAGPPPDLLVRRPARTGFDTAAGRSPRRARRSRGSVPRPLGELPWPSWRAGPGSGRGGPGSRRA